jgi:hypothetical protein
MDIYGYAPKKTEQEFIVEGKEFDKYHQLWLKKLEEYYTKYI